MSNITWTINIRGKETYSTKYFISSKNHKNVSMGSDLSQDIYIEEAFPQHVSVSLDNNKKTLSLTAHKKLIYEWQGKKNLITKNQNVSIPITDKKNSVKIHIRNFEIENTIHDDTSTIDSFPEWQAYLEKQYGQLQKIGEEKFTWIYQAGKNVFKILKPAYTMQNDYVVCFLQAGDQYNTFPVEQTPKIKSIISDEDIKLHVWVIEYVEGQNLYDFLYKNKGITQEFITNVLEVVTDFIRDIQLQKRIYCALNPYDIFIDTNNNIFVFGLYRSQLIIAGLHEYIPTVNGFIPIPQVNATYRFDEATDTYLLALLLYFLTTLKTPFFHIKPQEFVENLKKEKFTELKFTTKISRKYKELIEKCLKQSHSNDVQDFWREFQQIDFRKKKVVTQKDISNDLKKDFFGKFLLQRKIGRGHLAVVYEAQDTNNEKPVILKIFDGNNKYVKNIIQEIQQAITLEHHNILRIIEANQSGDTFYIAYEYIAGQNLLQYISNHSLSTYDCLELVKELALALQYCHMKGVIHRNIKPTNIIIGENNIPYLVDFGLSTDFYMDKIFDRKLNNDYIYQSPTVLFGSLSPLHDVYSLGAILYKLLTKNWDSNTLFIPLGRRSTLSRDAESLCSKALAKISRKRYQNTSIFAEDIKRLQEYKSILAEPFSWRVELQRRNRLLYYAFVVLFLGILSGICIFTMHYFSHSSAEDINIDEYKSQGQLIQSQYKDLYSDHITKLNSKFSSDVSPESAYFEEEIKKELVQNAKEEYKTNLEKYVLPLYQKIYEKDISYKFLVSDIISEIIALSTKSQQVWLREYQDLHFPNNEVSTLEVLWQTREYDEMYLYQYRDSSKGNKQLLTFDSGGFTRENIALEQDSLKVNSHNLFFKAWDHFLDKKYFEAQQAVNLAIEHTPNFVSAYHLLCLILYYNSIEKENSPLFIHWKQKAYNVIDKSDIAEQDKKKTKETFEPSYLQRINNLYKSILLDSKYLLFIERNIDNSFKRGDFIYKINNQKVLSSADVRKAIGRNKTCECQVIRENELLLITTTYNTIKNLHFSVTLRSPSFFVNQNNFVTTQDNDTRENQITQTSTSFPVGDYLLHLKKDTFEFYHPISIKKEHSNNILEQTKIEIPKVKIDSFIDTNTFAIIPCQLSSATTQNKNTNGYLLGRYEVTISQWQKFLQSIYKEEGKEVTKEYIPLDQEKPIFLFFGNNIALLKGEPDWPIWGVSHKQVAKYIAWLNKNLPENAKNIGFEWRLPTKEEWEYAAHGSDNRKYPWGNFANPQFCNNAFTYNDISEPKKIGSFVYDSSPFMIKDMGGNVKEYISDGDYIALKGGSWNDAFIPPIDFTIYTIKTEHCNSSGLRLAAGLDPLN